jgi:acetate kinase
VFTAGIGENAAEIRSRSCAGLEALGICIDPDKNAVRGDNAREIQGESSAVSVLVIPTDEELEIADQALECIRQ